MKTFRKMIKKTAVLASLAAALFLTSCSGVTEIDNSGKTGLVRIGVDKISVSRDALPVFTASDFETYKLSWKNASVNQYKQWIIDEESGLSAYQMMNNELFEIPLGTYDFTLTANNSKGAVCKGEKRNITVTEETNLNFTLEVSKVKSSENGTISLNVSYPRENVTKLEVNRYATTDIVNYRDASKVNMSSYTNSSYINGTYSYSTSYIPSGSYVIEYLFYTGSSQDILIGKWLKYAYIAAGKTSSDSFTIDSFDDVFTITYNKADAVITGDCPLSFTARMDVLLPAAENISRTGYTFDGWYENLDEEGNPTGTAITGWSKTQKMENVILYAKWTKNIYNVKYHTEIPSDGELSETPFEVQNAEYETYLTAPETNPEKSGYTFVRWTTSAAGTAYDFENTPVTGAIDLYAVWTFNVAFNKNNEDASGEMDSLTLYTSWIWSQNSVELPENVYEFSPRVFLGWMTSADGSEVVYQDGDTVQFNSEAVLYAKWTESTYPVKYYTNLPSDGILDESPFVTQTVNYNAVTEAPENNPVKTGYVFERWTDNENGTAFNFEDSAITSEKKLYAVWSYEVSFNKNDENASGTMENQTLYTSWIWSQNSISLPVNAFVNEEKIFLGWATTSDAESALYADGVKATITAPATLYALWYESSSSNHLVRFDSRGGSSVLSQVVEENSLVVKPVPSNDEALFLDWYTSTDDGSTLSLTPYDFNTSVTSDFVLYAKWLRTTYYVKANGNNNSGDGSLTNPYATVGKAINVINTIGKNQLDYTIVVCGSVKERVSLTSSNFVSAKSLVIRGLNGNDTDKLDGDASGTVLTISTSVPIILKDIAITNGSTTEDSKGAGIQFTAGNLTLDSGTLITLNESIRSNYGSGIAIRMSGSSTVTMNEGVVICNNNRNSNAYYAPGIYMDSSSVFNMTGGEIYGNSGTNNSCKSGAFDLRGSSVLNMTGGIIRDNKSKSYGAGGAICLSESSTLKIGENAYIPYGGSNGMNDIYKSNSTSKIIVTSELTASTPVASVNCNSASIGTKVLYGENGVNLVNEGKKIKFLNTTYEVDISGTLSSDISKINISYQLNGGTHESGYPQIYQIGSEVVLKSADKLHYEFAGWYTTSDFYGEPLTILNETYDGSTLYARWIEKDYFTIEYKDAGGDDYSGNTISFVDRHYIRESETLVSATKTNFIFDGWYTSDDGGITLSAEPVTVLNDENCTSDITLYAKWIPYYTISYKDKGGADFSGTWASTPNASYYLSDSSTLDIPAVSKDGFEFIGWFLTSDCTGESVTSLSGLSGNITLYALWASPNVSVVIDMSDISITKTENDETGEITLTASDGYTDYVWLIDDIYATLRITGSSVSEDGKTFSFNGSDILQGCSYTIRLVAKNDYNLPVNSTIIITK